MLNVARLSAIAFFFAAFCTINCAGNPGFGQTNFGSPAPLLETTSTFNGQSATVTKPILRGQPIQLFDGNSLEGWVHRSGKPSTNWKVDDGTLFRAKGGGDLYHKHWFRDFDLTFEWNMERGENCGVKYRVQPYGRQMLGCEFQLQDDTTRDKQSAGGLYAIFEPAANRPQVKINAWNTARIQVCGQRVRHWLNDVKVVDGAIGSLDWLQRVEASKFSKHDFFGQNREGRIFLQDHGNPIWFRKITLVPMRCD